MTKKRFEKTRKACIATLVAMALSCTGLAAACAPEEEPEPTTSTVKAEDTQVLKNGNFEFFDVPEGAVHLIKSVENWSRSGGSSGTLSGIIDTSDAAWQKMADPELKDKLDTNNKLTSSDPDYENLYVDYNNMKSDDIPYADPYAARLSSVTDDDKMLSLNFKTYKDYMGVAGDAETGYTFNGQTVYASDSAEDKEFYYDTDRTKPIRYTVIENPETHRGHYDAATGKVGDTPVFLDENGNYYLDSEHTKPLESNVLMVHNYPTGTTYNGIEQHYTSQSVTLEANTAAEISLWVKTSNLKFDKGFNQNDDEDRGAYIEVAQTVASSTVDSFRIRAINTEKIIKENPDGLGENESNGWLKYTVYVNACDFADSTITINLGLGDEENAQKLTGYAFFDDVEVKKFISLEDEGCGYNDAKAVITDADKPSYCSLTGEKEDKIFVADKQVRGGAQDYSTRFDYLVDLAADNYTETSVKTAVSLNDLDASVELTNEKSGNKVYASAAKNGAKINGFDSDDSADSYTLPTDFISRKTNNDLLGIYDKSKTSFSKAADFNADAASDLSGRLNTAFTGDKGLNALSKFSLADSGSMLLILSAHGAAYTATVKDSGTTTYFTVNDKNQDDSFKIVSFWVKTSDMGGKTAATVKITDLNDDDNTASFTVDTTDVKTQIGDNEDIYNGWVQCFFFVRNNSEEQQSFKIDFSFGNTAVKDSTNAEYAYGYAALANIQTLNVTEDVFELASEGSYAKILNFGEEEENKDNPFDSANSMTNVKKGIANPANYNGVNGGSSYVTEKAAFGDDFDRQNNPKDMVTGLINRDSFEEYDADIALYIAQAFDPSITNAVGAWNQVFGEDCYQPLIIVNKLRSYYDKATIEVTEENFESLKSTIFVKDDATGNYVNPTGEWKDNKDKTFYSAEQLAKNFGYIGNSQTVSASSYTTVSVRVKVSEGAVAYVYLVDPSSHKVMQYETPEYTFFYDEEGNVLSEKFDEDWSEAEHREKIVYTLREDGLYKDKDGNLFANLYNLTKRFKYAIYEDNKFYNAAGEEVNYDDLADGETYYSDKAAGKTNIADHYLVVNEKRVFEYDDETDAYYYMVNGERGPEVQAFDVKYARFTFTAEDEANTPKYMVKVEDTHGEWQTVNFIIHSGDVAKNYRLELWSGERGSTGYTAGEEVKGAVAFDYSSYNVAESDYSGLIKKYENAIIEVYQNLLIAKKPDKLSNDLVTIDDYKKALAEAGVTDSEISNALDAAGLDKNFAARYYSYTLYDSAKYVPFNGEVAAEGEKGYDYTIDNTETLTYFSAFNKQTNSYNMFIDYSAFDQTYEIQTEDTDDSEEETEEEKTPNGSAWLLITSIVLVIALLFALVAILVRQILKKHSLGRNNKNLQKNNYKKRERYIRRLGLVKNEEAEEVPAEAPEEPEKEAVNAPEEPEKEAPAEAPEEKPEGDTPEKPEDAEEKPEDNGEKPEEPDDKKDE